MKRPFSRMEEPRVVGWLDGFLDGTVRGWAAIRTLPKQRLIIQAWIDGKPVGRDVADLYREDLEAAGIGDGHHGFSFSIAAPQPESISSLVLTASTDSKPGSNARKLEISKLAQMDIFRESSPDHWPSSLWDKIRSFLQCAEKGSSHLLSNEQLAKSAEARSVAFSNKRFAETILRYLESKKG